MANQNQKQIAKIDRAMKRAGKVSEKHGANAFQAPDKARQRLVASDVRSWKISKRHPANMAIGTRKCGDEGINTGPKVHIKVFGPR